MWFSSLLSLSVLGTAAAQQFQGTPYDNQMSDVPGSEKVFWKITDQKGRTFSQLNYFSQNGKGQRLKTTDVKRVVLIIHGIDRDPDTYMSNALSALSQNTNGPANFANTQIIVPMFPTGSDKHRGYPWNDTAPAGGYGSTSNALVWQGSGWVSGNNNQYPRAQTITSSYDCLDQMIQYFGNKTLYPYLNQIVVAGHSAGAQTTQRYASVGKDLSSALGKTRLTYWVGNPNSWLWFNTSRPLDSSTCSVYNDWREGLNNYTPSYNTDLVARGGSAVRANYQSKSIAYLRSLQDFGDDSSDCAPLSQGANRDERFFNFIASFPPTCGGASDPACDTIDYIQAGHDAGAAFASSSGLARLFNDNFNGDLSRTTDFYCPRQAPGDNPLPDATCTQTNSNNPSGTYNNMTYQGCWTDAGSTRALGLFAYSDAANNSVDLCTYTCSQKGYKLAGMEYGSECYCGNVVAASTQQVADRDCYTACPGNSTQTCGTNSRLSIWGTSAPSLAVPASALSTAGSYQYAGCYLDSNPSRALSSKSTTSTNMTNGVCASFCSGYKYFATEYSTECYCGDIVTPGNTKTNGTDCSMPCGGDGSQLCGAGNRLTLYALNGTAVQFGQPSTTTTTTTVSSPTANPANGPACPSSDNSIYNSTGASFELHCGIDYAGGDISALNTNTFGKCIDACASTTGCNAVAYVGTSCYLKGTIGAPNPNGAVWGAKVVGATSNTSSTTGSTTAAASSATSLPVSCPSSDGKTYAASNGEEFLLQCGTDHAGGDIGSLGVGSYQECLEACAARDGCIALAHIGGACYLKGSIGAEVKNGVSGAILKSAATATATAATSSTTTTGTPAPTLNGISCPASNQTTYTAADGDAFIVECGKDFAGGDLAALTANTFAACVEACSSTAGCVALAYSGSACYLKSRLNEAVYNGIWGARLASPPASSSSSTFTTSTVSATPSPTPSSTAAVTCPADDGTTYTSSTGTRFNVQCGTDHEGGDMPSPNPAYVADFASCLETCARREGCMSVALAGNACYLKSSIGASIQNGGVVGAAVVT